MPISLAKLETKPLVRRGAVNFAVRGASLGGRIFMVIWGLGFAGIPLFMLTMLVLGPLREFAAAQSWREVPAVVTRSEVAEVKGDTTFQLLLEYRYVFDGKAHAGKRIGINKEEETGRHAEMRAASTRYPVGKAMVCWVNPAQPEEALLDRSFPWMLLGIIAFIIPFILIGLSVLAYGLGIVAWWKKRRTARRAKEMADNPFVGAEENAEEISGRAGKKRGLPAQWFLRLFGIPFAAAGIFVLSVGIREELALRRSQDWVETPCEILKSEVRTSRGDDSDTYSVYVRYRYTWEGREMLGERYNFSSGSDSEYASKRAAVKNYPAGKKAVCLVNPAQPDETVLVRERGDLWVLPWGLGIVFTLAGGGIFLGSFFINRKRKYFTAEEMQRNGPLPVRGRPAGKFWTSLALAVFWNGIVSIFAVLAVQKYRAGEMEWMLFGFVGVFATIGIFLAGRVIWLLPTLLGARLTVAGKRVVTRGETVPLSWEFSREPHGVESLKLRAECVRVFVDENEESSQQEKTELSVSIVERGKTQVFQRGEAKLTLPESARPSSEPEEIVSGVAMTKAGDERIYWQIIAEVKYRHRPKQVWKFGLGVR